MPCGEPANPGHRRPARLAAPSVKESAYMALASLPIGAECLPHPTRREFVKTLGTAALAATVPPVGGRYVATAETAVARFYKSLKDEQRPFLSFPSDHPKRSQVANNWA